MVFVLFCFFNSFSHFLIHSFRVEVWMTKDSQIFESYHDKEVEKGSETKMYKMNIQYR